MRESSPPVVFVKAAPDAQEFLSGRPFARQQERDALQAFCKAAHLARAETTFAVSEYLDREATRADFSPYRTEFLKALEGKVVVSVGAAARDMLGTRAHAHIAEALGPEEIERKARALRRLLDDASASCEFAIKFSEAYASPTASRTGSTYLTDRVAARVASYEEEQRIVYGVVLDPYQVDTHKDWIPPGEIEQTAREFMRRSRLISLHHAELTESVVVESFVEVYPSKSDRIKALRKQPHRAYARKFGDDVIHSGAWILGVEVEEKLWPRVQSGELAAFSIEGLSLRVPRTTADMPAVEFVEIG